MRSLVVFACCLSLGTALYAANNAPQAPEALPALSATLGLQENLAKLAGKRASLHLRSGKELEGVVGEVSTKAVILQQLVGKEFFNAYVSLSEIEALSYRAKKAD
jgi:hypothetical protein